MIVSGNSDAYVLSPDGFESYSRAVGFGAGSCLGFSSDDIAQANLGDGNGAHNQTGMARWSSGCSESISGGNHFRYWFQNGTKGDSNAVFIAASVEMSAKKYHMIVPNGYDMGRDQFVGNATAGIRTDNTTQSQFQTKVLDKNTSLMAKITARDLNHNIGTDQVVYILQVNVVKRGTASSSTTSSASTGPASYRSSVAIGLAVTSLMAAFLLV